MRTPCRRSQVHLVQYYSVREYTFFTNIFEKTKKFCTAVCGVYACSYWAQVEFVNQKIEILGIHCPFKSSLHPQLLSLSNSFCLFPPVQVSYSQVLSQSHNSFPFPTFPVSSHSTCCFPTVPDQFLQFKSLPHSCWLIPKVQVSSPQLLTNSCSSSLFPTVDD